MDNGLTPDLSSQLVLVLLASTLPGGLGGLTTFLYGIKRGHFKNNKYVAKVTVEIVGGMIVASFLAFDPRPLVGFAVGLSWSSLVQVVRTKITVLVEAFLSQTSGENRNT